MNAKIGSRSLFPGLTHQVYLNHAAVSPISSVVSAEITQVCEDYANLGLSAIFKWLEHREHTRGMCGTLINAAASDIGFVANTTSGIQAVAWSIDWRAGDRILLFDGEFPTNISPWQAVREQFEGGLAWVSVRDCPDAHIFLDRVEQQLVQGVRLVAISAVQFQTGWRAPLKELGKLCSHYGAMLFVDAIQALGVIPLDVEELDIDALACGAHKWLMGVEGTGFVYLSPQLREQQKHRLRGWLSHENGLDFLFNGAGHLHYERGIKSEASWVEGGAQSTIGLAALGASLSTLLTLQIPSIFAHITNYIDQLEMLFLAKGYHSLRHPTQRSAILSLRPPATHPASTLPQIFEQLGVAVTCPDGLLRCAPHWPNSLAELELIESALAHIHR